MSVLGLVVGALWAMLPAYVPNNAAVLFGGGAPVDGGRRLGGRRLLGDGKTWRGTIAGTLAGVALAVVLDRVEGVAGAAVGVDLVGFPLGAAVALAAGAMLGDIGASFLKRRLDRGRGHPVPVLDQLDFVVGALALAAVVTPGWFVGAFPPLAIAVIVVATPLLHVTTNVVAYVLDLKPEPW